MKWDKIQKNLARWKEILQNVPGQGFDKGKQETIDLRTEPASRLTKLENSKQASKQVYTNSLQSAAGQGLVYRGRMENACHIQTHGDQLCSAVVNRVRAQGWRNPSSMIFYINQIQNCPPE